MWILIYTLLTVHVIVSVLLVAVVLMQRPRSEGLGAAFGGDMTANLFGAQTTHVLAKSTTWLGGIFFLLTLILAMLYAKNSTAPTLIQKELMASPAPVTAPAEASASPAAQGQSEQSPAAPAVSESVEVIEVEPAPAASPAAP